jgi:hypothetical protein
MLLVDQFEEVFRPEVEDGLRQAFLDMLVVTHRRIESAAPKDTGQEPGLFLVLTMRSEELHRCTEHNPLPEEDGEPVPRSLTDLVNKSFYLLRLLDPDKDEDVLRYAILNPVRNVLRAYELMPDEHEEDYPYAPGTIDWLLKGAAAVGGGSEHQPDQMPLLQHALRRIWLNAVMEWPQELNRMNRWPVIEKRHLFISESVGEDYDLGAAADLRYCLELAADRTAVEAGRDAIPDTESMIAERERPWVRDAILKAIFRALARRDDRNNWARRFATIVDMDRFLLNDPVAQCLSDNLDRRRQAIDAALGELTAEGLLHRNDRHEREYDISHEALIRNWKRCEQRWLNGIEIVAGALARAIVDLSPPVVKSAKAKGKSESYLISERAAADLAPLDHASTPKGERLPHEWAWGEILPRIDGADARRQWSLPGGRERLVQKHAANVLDNILSVRRTAENERRRKRLILWGSTGTALIAMLFGAFFVGLWQNQIDETNRQSADKTRATKAAVLAGIIDHASSMAPPPGQPSKSFEAALGLRYAFDLVSSQNPDFIKFEALRPRATDFWDRAVRDQLGAYLIEQHKISGVNSVPVGKICMVIREIPAELGENSVKLSEAAKLVLRRDAEGKVVDESHEVKLAQVRGKERGPYLVLLSVDGRDVNLAEDSFYLPAQPGDRICLSDDATMIAWRSIQSPWIVTFGELNWTDRGSRAYVTRAQWIESDGNPKNTYVPPKKLVCIDEFLSFEDKGGTFKGVGIRNVGLAGERGEKLDELCDGKNTPIETKRLLHFSGLTNFMPVTVARKGECKPPSHTASAGEPGDAVKPWDNVKPEKLWKCDDVEIAIGRPPRGPDYAVLLSARGNDKPSATVATPARETTDVSWVARLDDRIVIGLRDGTMLAMYYGGPTLVEFLRRLHAQMPVDSSDYTPACAGYLPGCKKFIQERATKGD